MANSEKLKEIDELIKNRYPNNLVLDGIVNYDKFITVNPKILWILKESNIVDPENYKDKNFSLKGYLDKDVTQYPDWKKTWQLVMAISDAIIHNAKIRHEDVSLIERLLKEEVIKKIAVINIKKTGGNAISDQNIINDFYQKDKDIILAQIEAIAPDIIINCSRVNALFDDIKVEKGQQVFQFDVAKSKNGIIVNGYHPNQRDFSHERYFELIRDCIKWYHRMKKYFDKLTKVNERQVEYGKFLGLDLNGLTQRVAKRMIDNQIEEKFEGKKLKEASENQIALGKKFGFDFSKMSFHLAYAYISDIMDALNYKNIDDQNIKPGDHVFNKYDKLKSERIVSSIKDGYIFYKKSGGSAGRHLIKINKELLNSIFEKYDIKVEVE